MKSTWIRYVDRVGLALVLAAASGGILWTGTNIVIQQRQLQRGNDLVIQEAAKVKLAEGNLQSLRTAHSRLRLDAADLYRRIPPRIEMGALVKELHGRMKERKLTLTILQPQAPLPEGMVTKIPIRLVFQGSFVQVYQFFYDVEKMDLFLAPEKMTISGSGSPPGNCQVDLTLMAFERKTAGSGG
jgi:Tfp pilus assembly protein PilO